MKYLLPMLLASVAIISCSNTQGPGGGGGRSGGGGPGGGGGGQGGGRGGPPQEAINACSSSAEDDACSFSLNGDTLSGTCGPGRRGNGMICRPSNRQERPDENEREARGGPSGGQQQMREHTVTQSSGLDALLAAAQPPIAATRYSETIAGDWRMITANSIASHATGVYPDPGCPSTIAEQNISVRVPATPEFTGVATKVKEPGYSIEGVKFDPGVGEFYLGKPALGWQYEALAGAVPLGLDENYAHVQPSGHYHYHGLPTGLMAQLDVTPSKHSAQIGWAVDGFPIYALYGYADPTDASSGIVKLTPSYALKDGSRPSYGENPGGSYDGTFTNDWDYVQGAGMLDECNGRMTVTPDYPNGTYAYFLTDTYPLVPRCVKGKVEERERMGPPPR